MTNYASSLEFRPGDSNRHPSDMPAVPPGSIPGGTGSGLRVRNVTKRWDEHAVLDDLALEIPPGTSAWVGGRNGVGKTTLLRIVAGLIAADHGEVSLDGLSPQRDRRRYQRRLGFLSAGDRGLYARLTVRHNLQLWARLALLSTSECETAVADSIEAFGLSELADGRADRLSLGQRQRVRLALAFLHSPRLVLLDEPANSLDDHGLSLIAATVTELHRRGGMTIWCSPNRPELEQIGRGYVLNEGRLSEDR